VRGVWAAIATPFDKVDAFDEDAFRENVRRLARAGVHGVYTTDADGEFYALEIDEFRALARALGDESRRAGVAAHMGVSWINTAGVMERLRVAQEHGVTGAHVGHPFFMELTQASLDAFWSDVAAACNPGFGVVHYNSARMPNERGGADYARMREQVPNLVSTKQVTSDVTRFASIVAAAPRLTHLVGEQAFATFMLLGASGVFSWFANANPRWMLDWYEACVAGRWDEARARQARMDAYVAIKRACLGPYGTHGIVNKAMAASSDFLVGSPRTRRPYLPVPDDAIAAFRDRIQAELPDMVWRPG
jgi:4-hydroxy-tetrahydrodipicolinate synthase